MMPQSEDMDTIAAALQQRSWAKVAEFLPPADVAALAAECRLLDARAQLQAAATGRRARPAAPPAAAALRGDRTCWFDPAAPTPPQQIYGSAMETLRVGLNRRLLFGLEALDAHYALYPPGTGYARHRDRFRDDDARVLSSVLYLNQDWGSGDGGELRLHLADGALDVLPQGGTLMLFLSAEIEHEVLPARRERLSIAGWFRRRSLLDLRR